MTPILFFAYGLLAYAAFLVAFLGAVGFVADVVVPKGINSGTPGPASLAILVNLGLLGAFAVQHTIMARPWFKKRWTTIIPKPIERSTYVLVASLLLLLMYWQWRPMPQLFWHFDNGILRFVLHALSALGWCVVLYASFLIDHFDLFGLRQVYLHLRGRPYTHRSFVTPALYRLVRNPLMLGFIIAFWSTPDMTQGHLLFAIATTGYILVGIYFEERDIAHILGEQYLAYRRVTPMLFPSPWRRWTPQPSHTSSVRGQVK